jgi:hypothetical protein
MRHRTTLVIAHCHATRLSRDRVPVKSSNKASTHTLLPSTVLGPGRLRSSTLDRPSPGRSRSDGRKLGLVGRESPPGARNARKH